MPPSLNFSQLDFVKPSSGFHPVTWERVIGEAMSLGGVLLARDFNARTSTNIDFIDVR
jgi:hypothetical protein